MLHITNGDSVAGTLRDAGFGPDVIAWRDVLHEGPVPAGLSLEALSRVRAEFITAGARGARPDVDAHFIARDEALAAAANHDETVLWFEHDLYDQLQLLQIMDWFAAQGLDGSRLSLICNAEYLGTLDTTALQGRFPARRAVSGPEFNLARAAWAAFRDPDPRALLPFLGERSAVLPFVGAAVRRHLQQFPDAVTGLSRSESQALGVVAARQLTMKQAFFASHHRMEEAVFLGDTVFADYIERMSQERSPLIAWRSGEPVVVPAEDSRLVDFWDSELAITNAGSAIVNGLEDRILVNGIDRWLGGVHLRPGNVWRWHEAKSVVARSD